MPPKRAKSGGGSAGLAKWEQALLEAQFEEEEWKPNVTLVVGNKMEDYRHVEALHAVVAIPQRKLYSTVSKADLFEQVKELGNPKAKKGKETPQFYEICESVKPMLDEGLEVPILVLAKLLKFKLLDIKANDLKRREAEKKAAEDKAKGKTPGKDGKRPRSKSPAKGKGKKTPEPPAVKKDTKLKRRGEEDEENKYIDDEPDDGPQHYVLVHGFHQPQLVMALADVGVNVDSLLKITSEDYTIFQTPESGGGEASPREEQKKAQQDLERQQRQKAEEELQRFWKFLDPVLRRAPAGSRLHDMARLEYVVLNTLHPSDWEDADKKLAFGTAVFEDVACKIYDMYDWKRQFQHYLSNMKLLHVPLHGEAPPVPAQPTDSKLSAQAPTPGIPELDVPAGPPDVDMRYYNELMNAVPQESVSIPLLMHCMLEQVSATEEDREPPSERPVPPRQDGVDPRLASHMSGAAVKLALSAEEQMALDGDLDLATKPPEDKTAQRPLLLQHGDCVALRTHHLKPVDGFDPQGEELRMVGLLPVARLCELPPPSTRISKERAARLQELLHFCATGNLSLSEIDRAFKQFVFESMVGSTTDRSGKVLEPPLADEDGTEPEIELDVPWDDPFPFYQELKRSGLLKAKKKPQEEEKNKSTEAEPNKQGTPQPGTPPEEEGGQEEAGGSQAGSRPTSGRSRSRPTSARQGSAGSHKSDKEGQKPDENKVQEEEESKEAEQKAQEEEEEEDQTDHVTVNLIEATQKRQLDDWCFAEHFEPEVLIQVLDEAKFKYSHMDSYYHKRDHSMMMVFHNPLGPDLHNHTAWNTYLHSDVGFRNYLEHVTENISDWVRVEEAKFQAELLAKELALQKTPVTTPDTSRPSSSKSQRKRSQSPKKKSRSPSGKRSKRGSAKSPERPSSAARPLHVRENSLKAWKEEQDILKAEEERKAREKEEKRAKSASKKASRERGSSAGSAKSKSREKTSDKKSREDKEDKEKAQEQVPEIQEPAEPEVILPFTGYDVGNELIHAAGESVTLFPCDGGIIRTEKTAFVQDGIAVRTSVLKDGHLFVIHILDPRQKEEAETAGEESVKEKAELEKSEKEEGTQSPRAASPDKKEEVPAPLSRFGSFTAVLNDGMCLSLSNHGPSGKPKMPDDLSAKEVDIMTNIPPASTPTPPPPSPTRAKSPRAKSPKGKPKSPKGKRKEAQVEEKPPEPEEPPAEPEEPEEAPIPPFQQLFVSCPDGLNIRYFLEKDIGIKPETVAEIGRSRLLVRQTYPFKTRGLQKVEDLRKKPAMQEVSRCVNSDGTVVKVLHNGSTQVLFADGTISENPGAGPIGPYGSRSNSPSRPPQSPTQEPPEDGKETPSKMKKAAKGARKSITTLQEPEPVVVAPPVDEKANQWVTTSPSGERVATKGDGTPFDVKAALLCQASDPESGAVVVTREDKVISVHRPDASVVVEHCDGTRITTFYKDVIRAVSVDENETGESPRMETARVKHIKVECVGYATLLFNSLDGSCMTVFGNGSSLMTNLNGTYQLYHKDGGRLDMDADGTTVYAPRPDNDLGRGGEEELALGSYLMRHTTEMCCEMVDMQGNVFQVAVDGTTSVIRAGPYGEEEGEEEEGEEGGFPKKKKLIQYGEHCPRFFIIHANGSGTELLRPKDVAEYLSMAARDPTCALIQDPLPEYPGVTGITVLKPHTSGISQSWLKKLDEEVIMPKGLKSRDLKTMSVSAEKTPGPSFGTNVGKGLSVGSVMSSPRPEPVLHCPDTLEIRQLVQYKPVSDDLRKRLQLGLKAYAEHVLERELSSAALMVQDPRTEEEKIHAADLASQTIFGHEAEHRESADKKVTMMEGDVTTAYEKAVEVPPPSPPPTPRNKRTQDDWDRDRRELAEEQEGRNALKNKDVPPYFESEMGKHFLMSQAPDMDALTRELAHDPRRDGSQVIRSNPDSPISVGESPQGSSGHLVRVQETFSTTPPGENTPVTTEDSPSLGLRVTSTTPNLRPTNPTPAHASGTGTPTPLRPKNPTPHAAGVSIPARPGNPTPTQDSNSQGSVPSETPSASLSLRPTTIPEHPELAAGGKENLENSGQFTSRSNQLASADGELVTTRSLLLDVNNQPRKDTVRLPRALDGGKPGSLPNEKFSIVEEPVRRKVQTSSVAGATSKGVRQMGALRGLMAVPEDVDFGVLREGNTYVYTVQLKNVGVDSCRFKVKQPPPSTGLRVLYNPGPIAAGMKADLSLEIYAIAVGAEGEKGVGQIAHHIEITTETDLMYLPVTATILTAAEHDNRSLGSPRGGKNPAAKLISTKPPSGQGILRPRRDVLIEGLPSMG